MDDSTTTRRRFLVAAMILAGTTGGLRAGRAWAQDAVGLDADSRRVLAAAARRLFPHAAIRDAVYAEVIDSALALAAANDTLVNAFAAVEAFLDAAQPRDFIDLDPDDQVEALRSIEHAPYFAAIQSAVLAGVYNHPAVWELVGYGGPSWQQGGYLNRGAGVVDWLEEPD